MHRTDCKVTRGLNHRQGNETMSGNVICHHLRRLFCLNKGTYSEVHSSSETEANLVHSPSCSGEARASFMGRRGIIYFHSAVALLDSISASMSFGRLVRKSRPVAFSISSTVTRK